MRVIIGYTRTDRANDYLPSADGYRPGAAQVEREFTISGHWGTGPAVAEAVFVATNAPAMQLIRSPLQRAVFDAIHAAQLTGLRSVSVGDTVSVRDVKRYACTGDGWAEVPLPPRTHTVTITREQLQEWAGRRLRDDEVDRLDEAIPQSSIPEAIATIVAHLNDQE